jgi:hypothetical protein
MRRLIWSSSTWLVLACAAEDPGVSAFFPPDSSSSDAGTSDAGTFDSGAVTVDASTGPIDSGVTVIDSEAPSKCVNLQCRQRQCTGGGSTTISGKVFDPAGNNPLYGVAVYVPNATPAALRLGASCAPCDSLYTGSPITSAVTDANGKFTLNNVPDGSDVPLVVQIGKWRRQLKIAQVTACTDNPQPDGSLRLPRNRMEGDLPRIAVATGGADTLECLLRRVGVDASEYTPGAAGEPRVHIFQGNSRRDPAPNTAPAAPSASSALWNTSAELMKYDILLLSCEGQETVAMNQQALHDYATAGGRVFASHFHYAWFNTGPYGSENLATWTTGSNDLGNIEGTLVTTLPNGQPFPKGLALSQWLGNVGALQNGRLPIEEARHNANVSAANTPSQSWILADDRSSAPGATQYFSFNTPTNAMGTPDMPPLYCGRVVYSDLHVGAASGDSPSDRPVPDECANRKLSPQEAALEFMLFDLSACVTTEDRPPEPPPVVILQ